jgi:hypothetical protein
VISPGDLLYATERALTLFPVARTGTVQGQFIHDIYIGQVMRWGDESGTVRVPKRNPRSFRGTAASEPAPPEDRLRGSARNRPGSAADDTQRIEVSQRTDATLREYLRRLRSEKRRGVTINTLRAVYRRGAGAFSTSHDPAASRHGWGLARVKAFLTLVDEGKPRNPRYVADNDLLPRWHPLSTR